MTNEKLSEYKKKLEHEKMLISGEIKQNEKPIDLGADVIRFEEESDASEEIGNQLAIAEDLKHGLAEIDNALGKIEAGRYGACESCGQDIEEEILDIDPESRFCRKDKAGK